MVLLLPRYVWIALFLPLAWVTAVAAQTPQDLATRQQRKPADDLHGPPFVTCKAWAIADARTGKLLYGQGEDQRLDHASTTKMMTAFLVLRLAESDPAVLQQQITFSENADKTGGSTSGLKAGEQISVEKLLYGLLLPSGNDASVALAEHFGARFDPAPPAKEGSLNEADANGDQSSPASSPGASNSKPMPLADPSKPADADSAGTAKIDAAEAVDRFIAEMNRTAAALGMKNTSYKNTHGLTAAGHQSSVRDLLLLATEAMKLERFRHYVSTPRFKVEVGIPGEPPRIVVWENTNQLLATEGYDGIKTGTTGAAGACLVSSGRRGDDHLFVAVLGSANSDARYVDTRNLFRWAWRQRGHQ